MIFTTHNRPFKMAQDAILAALLRDAETVINDATASPDSIMRAINTRLIVTAEQAQRAAEAINALAGQS